LASQGAGRQVADTPDAADGAFRVLHKLRCWRIKGETDGPRYGTLFWRSAAMRRGGRVVILAMVLATGMLLGGFGGGCWSLASTSFLGALNPCGIIDCTHGLFGGAIDPCGVPGDPTDDIFVGCP